MLKDMKVCTISKYPPYMSGHSFEALYQGRALLEMTGEKHYEVTYDQSVYDKTTNYNNSSELMSEAEQYLNVYRMLPADHGNVKVLDGALIKAFIGQVIQLISENNLIYGEAFPRKRSGRSTGSVCSGEERLPGYPVSHWWSWYLLR